MLSQPWVNKIVDVIIRIPDTKQMYAELASLVTRLNRIDVTHIHWLKINTMLKLNWSCRFHFVSNRKFLHNFIPILVVSKTQKFLCIITIYNYCKLTTFVCISVIDIVCWKTYNSIISDNEYNNVSRYRPYKEVLIHTLQN